VSPAAEREQALALMVLHVQQQPQQVQKQLRFQRELRGGATCR